MPKNILALTAALLFVSGGLVVAHPHMWIDYGLNFEFSSTRLSSVRVTWSFDEASSAEMIPLYDSNRDGLIKDSEVRLARDEGFSHLLERGYFTQIAVGGTRQAVPAAMDFGAGVEEGRLVYSFVLPVELAVPGGPQGLTFSQFDDEFFVEFRIDQSRITVNTEGRRQVTAQLVNVSRVSTEGWEVTQPEIRLSIR